MEGVFAWLNQPLTQGGFLRMWMACAAGAVALAAAILALCLVRRRKKRSQAAPAPEEPTTEQPAPLPVLELANLQGLGDREEQQDAFGLSRWERLEQDGLLAVLCDGMGGMAEGGRIAAETAAELIGEFPWADDSAVPAWVRQRSSWVYQQFRGHGGTTLVAALLRGPALFFWCVGDSVSSRTRACSGNAGCPIPGYLSQSSIPNSLTGGFTANGKENDSRRQYRRCACRICVQRRRRHLPHHAFVADG